MKDILRNSRYMKMFIANAISRFGDSVDMIAFGYMVYAMTGSKVLLASIYVCNVLPNILFSTFSGTVVDFFSKKKVIVIGDLMRGVTVFAVALMFHQGWLSTWHLFVMTFFNSTIETFVSPSKFSTVAKLISEEQYLAVNSTMRSITKLSELLGVGIAGVIIGWLGIPGALAIDAGTFLLSTLLVTTVKFPREAKKALNRSNYSEAYKAGMRFVLKTRVIIAFIIAMAMLNFLLTPLNAFMPAYVDEVLGMGPEGISYLSLAFSLGSVIGGIISGQIGKKIGMRGLIFTGLFFSGIFYGLMGLPAVVPASSNILFIAFSAGMVGLLVPFAVAGLSTVILSITPKDMLSRVGAVINMFGQIATPMGAFVAGALIVFIPLPTMIVLSGILFVLTTFVPLRALSAHEAEQAKVEEAS